MRSRGIAALPQSAYGYTWKGSATQHLQPALPECDRSESKADHSFVSWKAYLASREFQIMASDLADAVFSTDRGIAPMDNGRPAILGPGAREPVGKPSTAILTPVLKNDAGVAALEPQQSHTALDLAIAA